MTDSEVATDKRQSDILANIQYAIWNGTPCFETDDVDDIGCFNGTPSVSRKPSSSLHESRPSFWMAVIAAFTKGWLPFPSLEHAQWSFRKLSLFQTFKGKIWICDITKSI